MTVLSLPRSPNRPGGSSPRSSARCRQAPLRRARAVRDPRRRPRPDGGLPGPRQDAGRPLVRAGPGPRLRPRPPRTCCPRTSPARSSTTSATTSSPSAGARSSPACCWPTRSTARPEDAVSAARGDAGGSGHGRGRDLPPAPPVPRAGHRQPRRVRGHLPAARGAARPLPPPRELRLPHAPGGGRCSSAAPVARRRRRWGR